MPAGASSGSLVPVIGETPSGTVNGINTVFTLSRNAVSLALYTRQIRYSSSAFTLSGTTLTITDPRAVPVAGNAFTVDYVPSTAVSGGFVLEETPGGARNSTNTVFTLAHTPVSLALYVQQIRYGSNAFTLTASGFTITDPRAVPGPNDFFVASYTY